MDEKRRAQIALFLRGHRCIYNTMCSCNQGTNCDSAQGYREHLVDVMWEAGFLL